MTAPLKITPGTVKQAMRNVYEASFYEFIKAAWHVIDPDPFVDNWHIHVIAEHMQAVAEGKFNRLLINIPPGTGKSLIVSVLFPAWMWTRDPSKRIISAAFSEKLAGRDSRKTRDLVTSVWYQNLWPIPLKADANAKKGFENVHRGAREAMPIGSMTGSRGNIVLIDDPHSVKKAESEAERTDTVDQFLSAVPNRLNDLQRDSIIVMMQRLHTEDVSGAILDRPGLGYVHLCIPMIAEEPKAPTPLGWVDHRSPGELMFPEKFPHATLNTLKASMGPFKFAGQYQQRPAPENNGFFERSWFEKNRFKPSDLPTNINLYMTSDHAPGGKNDFNVLRIWGVDENRHLWLVDSFRKRCTMDVAMGLRKGEDGKWQVAGEGALHFVKKYGDRLRGWYPENDPAWITIRPMVTSAMMDLGLTCYTKELPTRGAGDKVGKAQAFRSMASMKMVHLPEGDVGDTALEEYVLFPVGRHDDQVDSDGAIARVLDEALPAFVPEPQVKRSSTLRDYDALTQKSYDYGDACWG